ncbi:helix-turn-helix domain-containing protein [Thermobifida cellulosilytica]|uniref:XRE family transcriptional regulator n=1 Tax=Thermobifida cellulosilytica TB100 TaxID=665004 RepID=A0A147KJL1_THECS|nr:helix-turn-helix transcriptional regulator [Thermobifida cellulosilytica]KUP97482.1 XRE family transcriptional regulator [Thermobifida cellulosilytica TB100]
MDYRSPNVRRRRLGQVLRGLREQAGMTLEEAAQKANVPRSTLGRIETADARRLRASDLDALADLYKVDQKTREAMHQLAQQSKERGWWSKYRDVFGDQALPDWEAEASMIRTFEALTIPGLFQTPEYATAVFQAGRAIREEDVVRRVEARMKRREIFNWIKPPHMVAVIDEGALRRLVGGPEVMREQLVHLKNMAHRHHIDIQVLPYAAGAHLALAGPFTILDFPSPKDQPIVYVGTAADDLFLEQPDEIERYNVAFSNVQGVALSTALSVEFIDDVLKSLGSAS